MTYGDIRLLRKSAYRSPPLDSNNCIAISATAELLLYFTAKAGLKAISATTKSNKLASVTEQLLCHK